MSKEQAAAFGAISDCIDGAERVMGGPKPRTIEARTELANARELLEAAEDYRSAYAEGLQPTCYTIEKLRDELTASALACRGTVSRSEI